MKKTGIRSLAQAIFYFSLSIIFCTFLLFHSSLHLANRFIILRGNITNSNKVSLYEISKYKPVNRSIIRLRNSQPTLNYREGDFPPYHFKYLLNNEKLCSKVKNLTYLMYIFTRPAAFPTRNKIRQTWGRTDLFRDIHGRVLFLLGSTNDKKVQQSIENENKRYRDIVQKDFLDTYLNLTFKGIMAAEWITEFCSNAKYIIKVDDDVFVNVFKMIDFLFTRVKDAKQSMFCHVLDPKIRMCVRKGTREARLHPNFVMTQNQCPGRFHPEYCHGMVWVGTKDIFKDLYRQSLETPFVQIEDAFTTGAVRKRIPDLKLIRIPEFYQTRFPKRTLAPYQNHRNVFPLAISVHGRLYQMAWELTQCKTADNDRLLFSQTLRDSFSKIRCRIV